MRFPFPCCPGPTRQFGPQNLQNTMVFQWFLKVFAFLGALVMLGVCVLRGIVDFSCPGGQVEASRGVLEAFGGHSGGQKPSKTIEKHWFL